MSLLRSLRKVLTCVGLVSALCVVAYFLSQFIYEEEELHDAEVKRVRHTRGLQSVSRTGCNSHTYAFLQTERGVDAVLNAYIG